MPSRATDSLIIYQLFTPCARTSFRSARTWGR